MIGGDDGGVGLAIGGHERDARVAQLVCLGDDLADRLGVPGMHRAVAVARGHRQQRGCLRRVHGGGRPACGGGCPFGQLA